MPGRIYVSGPMSGKHLWNFPAFFHAEEALEQGGWDVVNPARIDEEEGDVLVQRRRSYFNGDRSVIASVMLTEEFDFRKAIDRDLELIEGCTAIYLLRGWEQSLGAGIELDRALRLGLEVICEPLAKRPACLIPQDQADVRPDFEAPLHPGPHPDDVAFATDRDEGGSPTLHTPSPSVLARYQELVLGDDDPGVGPRPFDPPPLLGYGEVRITDPETGGEKGSKLARYDLIPHEALHALAEHFGRGAEKYADRNWERGYDWALTFAALNRHLWAWWGGEDVDPETGSSHMTAVAWHAFVAVTFQERGLGTDTRPATVAAIDEILKQLGDLA